MGQKCGNIGFYRFNHSKYGLLWAQAFRTKDELQTTFPQNERFDKGGSVLSFTMFDVDNSTLLINSCETRVFSGCAYWFSEVISTRIGQPWTDASVTTIMGMTLSTVNINWPFTVQQ